MATVADRMITEIAPFAKLHDYDISHVHHLIIDTLDSLNVPTTIGDGERLLLQNGQRTRLRQVVFLRLQPNKLRPQQIMLD